MDSALHSKFLAEVLADIAELKAQVERLSAVADYHSSKIAPTAPIRSTASVQASARTSTNGKHRYDNMGQREAALAVLRNAGSPMRACDIARAMIDGGFPYHRKVNDLANSLFTSFTRGPQHFKKVGKGVWALADPPKAAAFGVNLDDV